MHQSIFVLVRLKDYSMLVFVLNGILPLIKASVDRLIIVIVINL